MGITLFVLGAIAMVVIAVLAHQAAERRRAERMAALTQLAGNLGLAYNPGTFSEPSWWSGGSDGSPFAQIAARYSGVEIFERGHSKSISNVLYGDRNGINWTIFDYEYKITTSTGKSTTTTTYHVQIIGARIPVALPAFSLSEEGFGSRIAAMMGAKDIQFEFDEFNRRYRVMGSDRQAVMAVLDPRMIEFLMSIPVMPWTIFGPEILIDIPTLLTPSQIEGAVQIVEDFVQRIPEYLTRDHGFTPTFASPFSHP